MQENQYTKAAAENTIPKKELLRRKWRAALAGERTADEQPNEESSSEPTNELEHTVRVLQHAEDNYHCRRKTN